MGLFIKKLFKKIDPTIYLGVVVFIIFTIYSLTLYIKLSFNDNFYDEYKSYYTILVEVKEGEINGKLNNFINIKHKNNTCYIKNCGFPSEGEFLASSIQFYEINKKPYIFKTCINEDKHCFYNITNEFIRMLKEKELNELKYNIKTGIFCLLCFLLAGVFNKLMHYIINYLMMEKEKNE